jgi:hypothetical protein
VPVSDRTARRRRQWAREGRDAAVVVSRERPRAPGHLSAEEKSVFGGLVRDLAGNGILARSDGIALETAATLIVLARECAARIEAVGRWSAEGRYASVVQARSLAAARPYVEQLALSPRGRHSLGMGVSRAQGPRRGAS